MKFNPSKCTILTISRSISFLQFYTLCGTVLQHTKEAKYLGVTISEDLAWGKHIQNISSKASSTLGFLKRNLSNCPKRLREQAYVSLIRTRLEYCSAIWDPHLAKDIASLENIQRRAARFTLRDYNRYTSVTSLLKDLNWAPLKDRRRNIRLSLLFKIVKGRVSVQKEDALIPADGRTRRSNRFKFRHLKTKTDTFKFSFFPRTLPEWNILPESCVEADTVAAFQARLGRAP